MSENRFADCEAVRSVLWRFHDEVSKPNCRGITDEALARIRELTPPPAVSEEARERAKTVVYGAMMEARRIGPDVPAAHRWLDRIIDALGYTPPNPCDELTAETERLGLYDRPPVPQPVVDLAPDELRWLAAVVEDYEKLYNDASRVVDIDTLPPSLELRLVDAGLPAKVVCGENCWVLRIGGTDE